MQRKVHSGIINLFDERIVYSPDKDSVCSKSLFWKEIFSRGTFLWPQFYFGFFVRLWDNHFGLDKFFINLPLKLFNSNFIWFFPKKLFWFWILKKKLAGQDSKNVLIVDLSLYLKTNKLLSVFPLFMTDMLSFLRTRLPTISCLYVKKRSWMICG
jgi:hypothetical protein